MANTKILNQVLDTITGSPQRWYQGSWLSSRHISEVPENMIPKIEEGAETHCGTTACLAGHAMLAGGEWKQVITRVVREDDSHLNQYRGTGAIEEFEVEFVHKETGKGVWEQLEVEVSDPNSPYYGHEYAEAYALFGAKALGIDLSTAKTLFYNTEWDQEDAPAFADWVRATIAESEPAAAE